MSLDLARRAQCDESAAGENRHTVADGLGLEQVVCRQQDGRSAGGQCADQLSQVPCPSCVQTAGRFVEEHDVGSSEEGTGEQQSLRHAGRVPPNAPVGSVAQANQVEQLRHAPRVQPAQRREEAQVLGRGQRRIDVLVLEHDADPRPDSREVRSHVMPEDGGSCPSPRACGR